MKEEVQQVYIIYELLKSYVWPITSAACPIIVLLLSYSKQI